jgi:hypothetical protein
MKTSNEIVQELKAAVHRRNCPIGTVGVFMDCVNGIHLLAGGVMKSDVEQIVGDMFNISLSKYVSKIDIPFWAESTRGCHIDIYVKDSANGETNIDDAFISELKRLRWKN